MPDATLLTEAMEFKPDLADAQRRWLAFWNHDLLDRPCCCIRAPKEGAAQAPWPAYMAGAREDPAAVAAQVVEAAAGVYWGGEAVPAYTPSFGPDMFSAWLGAELKFPEFETGTSWAEACIEEWDDWLPLRLQAENAWWLRMLAFCREMRSQFAGKLAVAHLDIHSNMDALLAMRGGERLCMDMIDCPETIDRAMADVRAQFIPAYDALYEAAGMSATGTAGWVPAYHPVRTNTIQCDFAALIGPRQFRRWAMPALEEEAAHIGHCVYHLDGPECLVHVPDLCSIPGLDCIQWTTGARNAAFGEWMELLHDIQSRGVAVWVPCSVDEIPHYHKHLKPNLVFYDAWAPTQKAAEDALDWLSANT